MHSSESANGARFGSDASGNEEGETKGGVKVEQRAGKTAEVEVEVEVALTCRSRER